MREVGDVIDTANANAQLILDAQIRAQGKPLEPGISGVCPMCGETSLRLVRNACARCRDRHHLP